MRVVVGSTPQGCPGSPDNQVKSGPLARHLLLAFNQAEFRWVSESSCARAQKSR